MSSVFKIREHTFDGQHIRGYPNALATSQEDILKLQAKSYTPLEVEEGKINGDITIIAYHANAIPKECYEPFFEALFHRLKSLGVMISSIWIADQASQNTSALLNDDALGNDFDWSDHSRDVILMVNTFRQYMKRPLVALGHSMGGAQAVMTSHLHPRLFEAMILIDPAINWTPSPTTKAMVRYALKKPSAFRSRKEAEDFVHKTPFFKTWQPEPMKKYLEHAFHDRPTALQDNNAVKLKTTAFAEVRGVVRPMVGVEFVSRSSEASPTAPVARPQSRNAYTQLQNLRPAVVYILGKDSHITSEADVKERNDITGTGPGGSGGAEAGTVDNVTIPGDHFLPMSNPGITAEVASKWLVDWLENYRLQEEDHKMQRMEIPKTERQTLRSETVDALKSWDGKFRGLNDHRTPGEKSKL